MTEAELEAMVIELQPLVGLPLQRIIQPDEHSIALRFMRRWVLLAAHPQLSRLHELEGKPRAPETPPAFCMLLRKMLLNGALLRLRRSPGDRLVQVEMPGGCLVAELLGRRSNLTLLDPQGVISGALKPRLLRDLVGEVYRPPQAGPSSLRRRDCRFSSSLEARTWFDELILQQYRDRLAVRGGRLLRKARKILDQVEGDLRRCQEAKTYKKWADLLLAFQHQLPARGTSAQVADLFEDGAPLDIPLNPALDIPQNAQHLYKKQSRLKKGRAHILARLERAQARVDQLARLDQRLQVADDDELLELASTLEQFHPRRPQKQPSTRMRPARDEPFRTFQARDGSVILVGKSATDNHKLTFHHARGRDTWLHVRDRPGAHGVIRSQSVGDSVPPETLLDAATLVAYFSGIKAGGDTDVSYALRKDVRPAGKPGLVYVSRSRTVHVVVLRERLDRLMGKKGP